MIDYYKQSITLHKNLKGKIEMANKTIVTSKEEGIADKVANAVVNSCSIISKHNHNRI